MSLLSGDEIRDALARADLSQRLVVMPLLDPAVQIGPASIDVRLGTQFRLLRRTTEAGINALAHPQQAIERAQERVTVELGLLLWLHPGQFVLGSTLEFLRLPPDLGGTVTSRSSWGRAGLLVATAAVVQPGYSGSLTLELTNHGDAPIALYSGSRVAQLTLTRVDPPTTTPYRGLYDAPMGPQVANLEKDTAELKHLGRAGESL